MMSKKLGGLQILLGALALGLVSCASTDDILVNKEPGFLYGAAAAADKTLAGSMAFDNLVYSALTETGGVDPIARNRFTVSDEMRNALADLKLKPFSEEKRDDGSFAVIYRMSRRDWDRLEAVRIPALTTELGGAFEALKADARKSVVQKIQGSYELLARIQRTGVPRKITVSASNPENLSTALGAYIGSLAQGISFSVSPDSGTMGTDGVVTLKVLDANKAPLASAPLSLEWVNAVNETFEFSASTNAQGQVNVEQHKPFAIQNQRVTLRVKTNLASLVPNTPRLVEFDRANVGSFPFRLTFQLDPASTDEVSFAAGTYTIGSLAQDTRAGSIEKPRQVTVKAFAMDRNLVTNRQYRTYLETIEASILDYPDYFDNAEFNAPDQPVIGVSLEDISKYAEWLSKQLGVTKRLPTEAEYEIAARAGANTIYPWGDQRPTDGIRANYNGNGRFRGTSPVGSFANGANSAGLKDMVGNVWQWTTTINGTSMSGNPQWNIVKGGSYLDGPGDLRISNRQVRNPQERHADVGFRLVREL